ncbi:cadherin repeat domain-containing protein [Candidatus Woesearchaeota archaeon]|nr:cadherin repeat domain-containing protein [Candidatus Woesearchaeota archaeon]
MKQQRMQTNTVILISLMVIAMIALSGCYKAGYDSTAGDDDKADDNDDNVFSADETDDTAADDDNGEFEDNLFDDDAAGDDSNVVVVSDEEPAETGEAAPAVEASAAGSAKVSNSILTGTTLTVTEGDLVELKVQGNDPDGDSISYTFSTPVDKDGRWQTEGGDAGTYNVVVTATDGTTTVEKTVKIVVIEQNHAPTIELLRDVNVNEGDTLDLESYLDVSDQDGDDYDLTYSGWMSSSKKALSYDDAGTYDVTVTASDGTKSSTLSVKVNVKDVNRAPEFDIVIE